jgi:hypothetical protein
MPQPLAWGFFCLMARVADTALIGSIAIYSFTYQDCGKIF